MLNFTKMLSKYYVAKRSQTNDLHSVHKEDCPFMPDDEKRIYLGMFGSGQDALSEGQKLFTRSMSCRFCINEQNHEKRTPEFSFAESHSFAPTSIQISNSIDGTLFYFLN